MSVDALAPPPVTPSIRRRRKSQPGLSILAQGEPLMWICGGSLAVCLLMILGLFGLIIYQGTTTFWPQAVYRVVLRDGSVFMGEYTRSEAYRLTEQMAQTLPGPIAAEAQQRMEGAKFLEANRQLLRTGNYDITNSDFQWISEFSYDPAQQTQPEWAIVVERLEWGRFYGLPAQFAERHVREPSSQEQSLTQALQFFQNAQYELADDADRAQLTLAVEQLQAELSKLQRDETAKFLQPFRHESDDRYVAETDGEAQPLAEVGGQAIVSEVMQLWDSPEAVWSKYQQHHQAARDRYHQRQAINKFDLGRLDNRERELMNDVLEQQLEHQQPIDEMVRQHRELQYELDALEQAKGENAAQAAFLIQRDGADSPIGRIAAKAQAALAQAIAAQQVEPRQQQAKIEQKIAAISPETKRAVDRYLQAVAQHSKQRAALNQRVAEIDKLNSRHVLTLQTAQQVDKPFTLDQIVRAYPANQLALSDRAGIYLSRWQEFLWEDPREANSEGGVFPAICGTVTMTLIMVFLVAPFGVLASLYLREYAKGGPIVSIVRISINNLAGVPSIVFGVFGLGFFCYIMGAYVDAGPRNIGIKPWPSGGWNLWLVGLLGLCLLSAVTSYYGAVGRFDRRTLRRTAAKYAGLAMWLGCGVLLLVLLSTTPYFNGFYEAQVLENNNPKFGKGALIWASLTLALLTLPVVIVATEEALAAVPNSLREGSYACGASKWQTIRRIVLPRAMPGIMTGMILAMARGAGEVAPLMLVGALKIAPALPLDLANWSAFAGPVPTGPVHLDRSFMHLGFHIYDLALQSRNSEAAKPMVFTTTLLLIVLIALLNLSAVWLRTRLRKRFGSGQF
jgi:phosphate transport system permease protein